MIVSYWLLLTSAFLAPSVELLHSQNQTTPLSKVKKFSHTVWFSTIERTTFVSVRREKMCYITEMNLIASN